MKIRTGFVSNSSSTSFAVSIGDYPTVHDLAIEMMNVRNGDWDDYDDEEVSEMVLRHAQTNDKELFDQIKDIIDSPNHRELMVLQQSKLDKNFPIAFRSTNYDTYLMKSGNLIFVSTCNNHKYELNAIPDPSFNLFNLDDFRSVLSNDEYEEIINGKRQDLNTTKLLRVEYCLRYATDFWWPCYDKIIRQFRFTKNRCNKHSGTRLVLCDGELVCPICDLNLGNCYDW